jgi:hypothetical protein
VLSTPLGWLSNALNSGILWLVSLPYRALSGG